MSFSYSDFAAALKAGAGISADDVLDVRRWVWPDGAVSLAEAEAVFALNRLALESAPEWDDFLIEAMTDYVVNETPPRGYVDDAHAGWLIDQIERDGAPITATELALVVKVLESALNAPALLKTWALGQIEASVLTGAGPTRAGPVRPGIVDEAEVRLLRRIIFAAGGDGALGVSADEAEALWRIKDACLHADNAPGWKTLFAQAIGNHLMAYSSYRPLARDEAARLEAFIDDHHANVLGFFARMRGASPAEGVRALLHREPGQAGHDAAVAAAAAVTPGEKEWLDAHIDADGARDPYEEALLAFIAGESGR
jgi:hypothetical protein